MGKLSSVIFTAKAFYIFIIGLIGVGALSMLLSMGNIKPHTYHELTVTNRFNISISIESKYSDSPDGLRIASMGFSLEPQESKTEPFIPEGENAYFIVAVNNSVFELGEQIFIDYYTWKEFEALNWSVVIEPGHEEPDW